MRVVHEQVMSDSQLKFGLARAVGEIIVVKEPESKPFIEPADRFINGSLHEQTKPRKFGHGEPLPAMPVAPCTSEGMHLADVAIRHRLDQLWGCGIIGHGADDAGSRQYAVGSRQ